jgi:hypothetical protein
MILPSFFPGNLNGSWMGGQITIDQAITVLRIAATAKTPTSSNCPAAVFRFTDGTKGQELVLTPGQSWSDSGAIMLTFTAGATLQATLRTGASCSTPGADVNLLVEYRMQATGDSDTCPGTLCGTFCTNTSSDPANCGSCGTICSPGVPCASGACGGNCPAGQSLCGGTCTNTSTDNNNCGACGNICKAGSCSAGQCVTNNSVCVQNGVNLPAGTVVSTPPGTCQQQQCDGHGNIINVEDDANLPASTQCQQGTCTAGVPGFIFNPAGTSCTPSGGGAGQCDGQGTCTSTCTPPQQMCSGVCVDTQTSLNNCGACGKVCANTCGALQACSGTLVCSNGSCVNSLVCQTIHSNGLGQSFYDCTALNTYNITTATEAANAVPLSGTPGQVACGSDQAISDQYSDGSCGTWTYTGTLAGHVNRTQGSCICPAVTDPAWK